MENVDLLELMKKSIEEKKIKIKSEKNLKGFLIINFNSNKYVNDFYKSIDGVISKNIKILNNSIILEFNNEKELREGGNLLDGILFSYKYNLIGLDFEPNWLDFYDKNKDFDIKNIKKIINYKLTKQDIEASINEKENNNDLSYKNSEKEFLINSNNYNLNNFVKDWEIYLNKKFDITGDKNELKKFLEVSIKNLKNELGDKIICGFESFFTLEQTIKTKSEKMSEKYEDREYLLKYQENKRKIEEYEENFKKNKNSIRQIWEGHSKKYTSDLNNLKIKFALKKEEEVKFNGVQNNYKEDYENNIDYRNSNSNLKYMMKEQGYDLNYLIISSMVSNYLSIVEQKQKAIIFNNLINISKNLDKKSYFDSLKDIIKNVKNYNKNIESISDINLSI